MAKDKAKSSTTRTDFRRTPAQNRARDEIMRATLGHEPEYAPQDLTASQLRHWAKALRDLVGINSDVDPATLSEKVAVMARNGWDNMAIVEKLA